jgi:hypothetical protein
MLANGASLAVRRPVPRVCRAVRPENKFSGYVFVFGYFIGDEMSKTWNNRGSGREQRLNTLLCVFVVIVGILLFSVKSSSGDDLGCDGNLCNSSNPCNRGCVCTYPPKAAVGYCRPWATPSPWDKQSDVTPQETILPVLLDNGSDVPQLMAENNQNECQPWQHHENGRCVDNNGVYRPGPNEPTNRNQCWMECLCYRGQYPAGNSCFPCSYAGMVCIR